MALAIAGTISVINFNTVLQTATGSTHAVTSGTDTLLFVWITRVRDTQEQPVFGAKWNGDDLTALSTNYSGAIHGDDFAYWMAAINAPDVGTFDLALVTGGFDQAGGTMLLINLTDNDTTNILGAITSQRKAATATNTVGPLSITPVTGGDNLVVAILGISQNTTLTTFTGTGFTAVSTGTASNNNLLTRTIRYKIGSSGAQSVSAAFGASDVDIGGVIFEIRGASATTTDKSGAVAISADVTSGAAKASKGTAPSASILEGKKAFTSTLIIQGDDTNVSRAMVRVGSNTTTRFGMKRLQTGVGGKTSVIACEALLDDGTSYIESYEGALTTGVSVASWVQEPGTGPQLTIDGQDRDPSYKTGASFSGGIVVATNPMEVGAYSDISVAAYSGLMGRWIVDSKIWTFPQRRLFAKSVLDPDRLFGWGERNVPADSNRSPVALPVNVSLRGAAYLDISPVMIDPDASQPGLVGVSAPANGTAQVLDNTKMRYTPNAAFLGKDSFTYTIKDNGGKSSTAFVDVTVLAGVITAVTDTISVQQDTAITFNPAANDTGGVGTLKVSAVGSAAHGTTKLNDDKTVTYTPTSGYTGSDTFNYDVTDGVSTVSGIVNATISASASANAVDDTAKTKKGVSIDIPVLDNDTPSGVKVDSIVTQPSNGTATIKSGNILITYAPKAGYVGKDSFVYKNKLSTNATTDQATVNIDIRDPAVNRSGLPWVSGADMISDGDPSQMTKFGTWRGRELDCCSAFMGGGYWNKGKTLAGWVGGVTTKRNGVIEKIKNTDRIVSFAYPMLLIDDDHNFAKCVNDSEYLKTYQANANEIKAIYGTASSADTIYVRIGWEANQGYQWSFDMGTTPDEYIPAWRKIALIWKNTCPNAKIVWNIIKSGKSNLASYYPGDDVVDIISLDMYDNGYQGGYITTEAQWQKQKGVYVPSTGEVTGWDGIVQFGKAKKKDFAIDEWGCSFNKDGQSPDNPTNNSFFAGRMFKWFNELTNAGIVIAFENYFNGAIANRILNADGETLYVNSPNVGKAYKAAWTP